jgi:hypothetical protein
MIPFSSGSGVLGYRGFMYNGKIVQKKALAVNATKYRLHDNLVTHASVWYDLCTLQNCQLKSP